MIPYSLLDLAPVCEGSDTTQAFVHMRDLAQHAERWGYTRYWLAEHHNMPGIASAATAVLIGHVAGATSTIRVGAGGIMLPNHSPLQVAEQFGTLASLYRDRIDLGLGRAPGTDQATARALRRYYESAEAFPQDVQEVLHYFEPVQQGQAVQAVPGSGLDVPVWILGSSLFGADLAAQLGMPYAFASHFAPDHLDAALAHYRQRFKPSEWLQKPYVMPAMTVFAAETDAEAELIASSQQQSFVRLRTGQPGKLPPPVPGYRDTLPVSAQGLLAHIGQASAVGSPATVRAAIGRFVDRTGADEIIVSGATYDPAAREHSLALTVEALAG